MEEIWKDIPEYEGLYQASNYGKIKSLGNGKTHKTERILKQSLRGNYLCVDLCKEGSAKIYSVHRLVWSTFNGKIPDGMQVNHINEVKTDNRLINLNLMSSKENINWGTSLNKRAYKQRFTNRVKSIIQYDLNGNFIREWFSGKEIERTLNIPSANIYACCLGKTGKSHNYIWKYKNDCQN